MMTARVRRRLAIFAAISVVAITMTASTYMRLPQQFGIGQYTVTADFEDASGIYPNALVAYRGMTVGRVTAVQLRPDGVAVKIGLDNSSQIPSDATARIRSTSAIGEQYIGLDSQSGASSSFLSDGSQIPRGRTAGMPPIGPLLDSLDELITSVPQEPLARLLDDVTTSFDGTDDDFGELLDSSSDLLAQAQDAVGPTRRLLRDLRPVLQTQADVRNETGAYVRDLESFTGELDRGAPDLVRLFKVLPDAAKQIESLDAILARRLPGLLSNVSMVLRTVGLYLPGIQQVLVVYPALVSDLIADVLPFSDRGAVPLDFRLNLNDPPTCTKGFLPVTARRDPSAVNLVPTPPGLYCKLPKNAVEDVRGARNLPCEKQPARHEATPELCGNAP